MNNQHSHSLQLLLH